MNPGRAVPGVTGTALRGLRERFVHERGSSNFTEVMVAAVAAWESKKLSNEVPLNTAEEMSLLVCEFNRLRSENKDIQEKRNPPRWTAKLGQYSEEAFARVMTPRFLLALFAMVAALVFIGNRPIPSSVMFAFSSMHQVSQVFQFQSSAALGVISQETTQDDLTSLLAEKLFKTAMLPRPHPVHFPEPVMKHGQAPALALYFHMPTYVHCSELSTYNPHPGPSECEYKDQPPSSIQAFHSTCPLPCRLTLCLSLCLT